MADLNGLFDIDESRLMEITHPVTGSVFENDKGKPMGIFLTDLETEACKLVISAFRNRFKKKEPSIEANRKFGTDLLVAATTGFENLQLDGKAVEYSPAEARRIYENSKVIRKQVDEFVGADENFIQGVLVA